MALDLSLLPPPTHSLSRSLALLCVCVCVSLFSLNTAHSLLSFPISSLFVDSSLLLHPISVGTCLFTSSLPLSELLATLRSLPSSPHLSSPLLIQLLLWSSLFSLFMSSPPYPTSSFAVLRSPLLPPDQNPLSVPHLPPLLPPSLLLSL